MKTTFGARSRLEQWLPVQEYVELPEANSLIEKVDRRKWRLAVLPPSRRRFEQASCTGDRRGLPFFVSASAWAGTGLLVHALHATVAIRWGESVSRAGNWSRAESGGVIHLTQDN